MTRGQRCSSQSACPFCDAALAVSCGYLHALVRAIVTNMVYSVQRELEEQRFAMLWLVSYLFLLRLPSEASVCPSVLMPCALL